MKNPFPSLLAVSMSLLVLLGSSGCANSNNGIQISTTSFAYLQDEASTSGSVSHADSLFKHTFSHAARTHRAGERAATSTGVDIQTGSVDLYVYDISTNTNTKLVTGYAFSSVQLSNDGTELLVGAFDSNGYLQVYLADSTFKTVNQLTSGDDMDHTTPSLSPDGTLVAYSDGDNLYTLSIKNGAAAGTPTEVTALTAFYGIFPVISSDDKTIVFTGEIQASNLGIFIYSVNLDTQALTQLSTGVNEDLYPAISPDGKKVAFARISEASNTATLNIVTIDITGETTADPATTLISNYESFEPQYVGNKIVYMNVDATTNYLNIWEANTDGSNQVRLTDESLPEFFDRLLFG